jgi:hypothetical protein
MSGRASPTPRAAQPSQANFRDQHVRPRFNRRQRHFADKKFYDAVLEPLEYSCLSEDEASLGYGKDQVQLWTNLAKRPVRPDMDSGLHFCLAAPTRKSVDAFHKAASAAGGRDNVALGLRADYGAATTLRSLSILMAIASKLTAAGQTESASAEEVSGRDLKMVCERV